MSLRVKSADGGKEVWLTSVLSADIVNIVIGIVVNSAQSRRIYEVLF
ncbi:MAG: hypothetical protein LBV16_08110 [Elusimicrobiota bacterium]|nr:hypothetical protein [Elusimicrobiota bacterium]